MCGAELQALPEGVQRVAAFLQDQGHAHAPVMLDDAARTAQQAADALGVAVGQIAKSIVFRRKSDDVAVLVVTSGDRRVDDCEAGQNCIRAYPWRKGGGSQRTSGRTAGGSQRPDKPYYRSQSLANKLANPPHAG